MSSGDTLASRVDSRNLQDALRASTEDNENEEPEVGGGNENENIEEENHEIPNRFNLSIVNCGPPVVRSESLVDPSGNNPIQPIQPSSDNQPSGNARSRRKRQRTGLAMPDFQQQIEAEIRRARSQINVKFLPPTHPHFSPSPFLSVLARVPILPFLSIMTTPVHMS